MVCTTRFSPVSIRESDEACEVGHPHRVPDAEQRDGRAADVDPACHPQASGVDTQHLVVEELGDPQRAVGHREPRVIEIVDAPPGSPRPRSNGPGHRVFRGSMRCRVAVLPSVRIHTDPNAPTMSEGHSGTPTDASVIVTAVVPAGAAGRCFGAAATTRDSSRGRGAVVHQPAFGGCIGVWRPVGGRERGSGRVARTATPAAAAEPMVSAMATATTVTRADDLRMRRGWPGPVVAWLHRPRVVGL